MFPVPRPPGSGAGPSGGDHGVAQEEAEQRNGAGHGEIVVQPGAGAHKLSFPII